MSFSHFGPALISCQLYVMLMVIGLIQFIACRLCSAFPFSHSFTLFPSTAVIILHELLCTAQYLGVEVSLEVVFVGVWSLSENQCFFYSDKSTLRCQTISNMHTENKCYVQELSSDKRKNFFVSKGPTLVKSIRIWAHFLDHSTKIYSVFVYLFQLANRLLCK